MAAQGGYLLCSGRGYCSCSVEAAHGRARRRRPPTEPGHRVLRALLLLLLLLLLLVLPLLLVLLWQQQLHDRRPYASSAYVSGAVANVLQTMQTLPPQLGFVGGCGQMGYLLLEPPLHL